MTTIGVVIPTIKGREEVLDVTLAAYQATTPAGYELDVAIIEGYYACGPAWTAGAAEVEGDYLHFGVDDGAPHPGWIEAATAMMDTGVLPAACRILPDGKWDGCGSMGFGALLPPCPTGTPCRSSPMPFMTPEVWNRVGEFLPIHYYTDDDWYWRAEILGYKIQVCREYCFTHYSLNTASTVGAWKDHMNIFVDNAATHKSLVPA